MVDVIVGAGQIGTGLGNILATEHTVYYHDPSKGIFYLANICHVVDYLHICIPGNLPSFVRLVCEYDKQFNPEIIVIHSTVLPGITKQLSTLVKADIVHSPVRGKHPDLAQGIKTYLKHVGYLRKTIGLQVAEHFEDAGIKTEIYYDPTTTELGKILELFRYGMEVMLTTKQSELCKYFNVEFDYTVNAFIDSYNKGLTEIGLPDLRQCKPKPMIGNHLGGHCVIENCNELAQLDIPEDILGWLKQLVEFGKGERNL